MKQNILNIFGAAALIIAAFILMLMGKPSALTPLQAAESIGQMAVYDEDKIAPLTLAEWIVAESGDFYTVDIRGSRDFVEINIPGSVNLPFASLMTKSGLSTIPRYKKIVLVYKDGTRAGQAWTVLRGKGYEAYILRGGIKGWWDEIMTPASLQEGGDRIENPAQTAAKVKAMRDYFSGKESSLDASGSGGETAPPPPVPMPQKSSRQKKKSGGC